MHGYNRIAGPIIDNHRKTSLNHRSQWLSRNNCTDCDCDIENHHTLTMVVICRPLSLPKTHNKQSNQRFCKNILPLQSFRSIIVNFSPFYPHTHNMSRIWACRNICCFWVFPQKIIAKHRSLNWKKHRKTIGTDGWTKIIVPIAMVRMSKNHRHRIAVT